MIIFSGALCRSLQGCLWMKPYSVTIQVKATWQYFSVALFTVLFNVVLKFWIRIFCMVRWGVQGGFDPKVLWVESAQRTSL